MAKTPLPKDFFSEAPPPRIIGTESECNIQLAEGYDQDDYISIDAIENTGHRAVNGFFDNGARVYVDVGHLEVDTAESLGPKQAAAGDFAAVLLLRDIVETSGLPHKGLHRYAGTVIGDTAKTSGYHQNFLMPRAISKSERFGKIVASHLTSQLWTTSGAVINGFHLSQKVSGIGGPPITSNYGRRTSHGSKPMAMVPTASQDHDTIGDNTSWARLEVRFVDPGFSPTARYAGMAATSLVLRLIEHPKFVDMEELAGFSFEEHAATAKRFNTDLTFSTTAETINGSQISAVDYQEMLAEAALDLSERIELPEDERQAIELWLYICDQLRAANLDRAEYAGLLACVDFAPRHRYLTTHFSPDELDSYNPEAVEANLSWDRLLPRGGGMQYWTRMPSPYISADEIQSALWQAPPTRASARGSLIANAKQKVQAAYWASVITQSKEINLRDPYATQAG